MRPPWAAVAAVCAVVLGVPVLVHGLVAAPENVTVQCSDHKPRVFWNYSSRVPTEFTVQFRGSGEHPSENKTVDHELDLRDLVWRSQKQMLDYMFIYITAGQRSNQSTRSPSFSYNKYKTADVKCSLMFPRGNLSVDGSGATLTLKNPLHIYKELEVIEGSCLDITVVIKNKTIEIKKTFSCREKVFKVFVELPEDSDLCVNVSGTIRSGNQEIQVLHPGPVCAPSGAGDEGPWVLLCLCFVIFLFVIVGLMVAICKTRAWIFPKAPIPNALVVNAQKERLSAPPSETAVSSVQIAGPGRVPESETEELVLIPPEDLQEDDSGESTKTETISVHSSSSEEIEVSNYERRPILIDLDDNGDVVTGYFS